MVHARHDLRMKGRESSTKIVGVHSFEDCSAEYVCMKEHKDQEKKSALDMCLVQLSGWIYAILGIVQHTRKYRTRTIASNGYAR